MLFDESRWKAYKSLPTSLVNFLKVPNFFKGKKFQKKRCRAICILSLWGENVYMSSGRKQKKLILVVVSGEENWLEGWHRRESLLYSFSNRTAGITSNFFNLCNTCSIQRERERDTHKDRKSCFKGSHSY